MPQNEHSDNPMTALRQSLHVIRTLQDKVAALEKGLKEPVAIIGMGCRLPGGATDPERFEKLLLDSVDAVGPWPADRWDAKALYNPDPDIPGTIYVRQGAFLQNVDGFDARFFGIAPREATSMDPQHRILLEVVWEALNLAGIAPQSLSGTRTGTFVGIGQMDYARRRLNAGDLERISAYDGTGNGLCFAPGRISYLLGLRGPSLAIDTACSASLVAVHEACRSLRSRECDLALAGGVHLVLSPEITVFLCRSHALSRDGRCKTFDAAADGYGRGEGCGMFILKRLADAVADRDPILAVIRGTAVNHDGASGGLTVPNGVAQEAVIRAALADAGLDAGAVGYIEAHGTGTAMGDPIEMGALAAVFARSHSKDRPLLVGSVKTNIGHLEAAAGAAGLMKAVLAVRHGTVPPHLHFKNPNPHIPWAELPFAVPVRAEPWPEGLSPRTAGVSSFGFSGTNAHLIVQQALDGYEPVRKPLLPPAFNRKRYWIDPAQARDQAVPSSHPLLGTRLAVAGYDAMCFENRVNLNTAGFIDAHRVFSKAIMPASAFAEMAYAAGREIFPSSPFAVDNLVIMRALEIPPSGEAKRVQTVVRRENDRRLHLRISSLNDGDPSIPAEWTTHAEARIILLDHADAAAVDPSCLTGQSDAAESCYEQALKLGFEYGPALKVVRSFRADTTSAAGLLTVLESWAHELEWYTLHPALIDGCFQMTGFTLLANGIRDLALPSGFTRMTITGSAQRNLWCVVDSFTAASGTGGAWTMNVSLTDETGSPVARIEGLTLIRASREAVVGPSELHSPSSWLYAVEWCEQPQPSDDAAGGRNRSATAIAPPVQSRLTRLAQEAGADIYATLLPRMEKLSAMYVVTALRECGLHFQAGRSFTIDELGREMGLAAKYSRLLRHLATMLVEDTVFDQSGDRLIVRHDPRPVSATEELAALMRQYPQASAELELLGRCGPHLSGVLTGRTDPLNLLFPEGNIEPVARLYESAPFARAVNGAAREAVSAALRSWPAGRPLRVLEIGAGTGGVTAHILPLLPANGTQYMFTDISPLFVSRAQNRFRDDARVECRILDIEAPPARERALHDLVIAANVLHAVKDLRQAVRHAHSLLAPGGLLVVIEATARLRWIDLTFGLTDGWWKFEDTDLRKEDPLISPDQWRQVLVECGFPESVSVCAPAGTGSVFSTQALMLATKPASIAGATSGTWLIVSRHADESRPVAALLESRGCTCVTVETSDRWRKISDHEFAVCPARPDDFRRLFRESPALRNICGVIHLWGLNPASDLPADTAEVSLSSEMSCVSLLHSIQALLEIPTSILPRVFVVTRGAQAVRDSETAPGIAYSPLWGMGRVIAQEHPDLRCTRIDLDPASSDGAADLSAECLAPSLEDQVAFRGGRRYVARLTRWKTQPNDLLNGAILKNRLRPDGAYLITGGLAGIGARVAQRLAERGARCLALIGRNGPGPGTESIVRKIEAMNCRVLALAADVTDFARLRSVVDEIERAGFHLAGIVHAAGVLDDGVLLQQNQERFSNVLAPKVAGGWNLHLLARERQLDFFVLFSAGAALLGAPGQSNHAAANAFLDVLAYHRRALGLPALSINWGGWSGTGAAARSGDSGRLRMKGLGWIDPEKGLDLFEQLLCARTPPQVGVLPIHWTVFLKTWAGSPFVDGFHMESVAADAAPSSFRQKLETTPTARRHDMLVDFVRGQTSAILGSDTTEPPDPQQGFFDLGMDSLTSMELQKRLQSALEIRLPSTLVFEHPTIDALVRFLEEQIELHTPAGEGRQPDDLSQDEVAELLAEKLRTIKRS